jgi:cell division septation protein DedD
VIVRRFVVLCCLIGLAACASAAPAPASGLRPLPADSAAMLAEALRTVRPAFATQAEAVASLAYADESFASDRSAAGASSPGRSAPPAQTVSSGATSSLYVIQIAAFREREVANAMIERVRRSFPQWSVVVEETTEVIRVALGSWPSAGSAEQVLPSVKAEYPDAWIRMRGSP